MPRDTNAKDKKKRLQDALEFLKAKLKACKSYSYPDEHTSNDERNDFLVKKAKRI